MNNHSRISPLDRLRLASQRCVIAAGLVCAGCGGPPLSPQASQSAANQPAEPGNAASEGNSQGGPVGASAQISNPITLFVGGDTPGAIEALVTWSASPANAREPVLLMDPINEADVVALGPAHEARLEAMLKESDLLRQLAGAAVREARSLAPTDPARAAQLLDTVERAGFIHRTAGANKLTTMVGEAIEKQAQKARAEVLPGSGGA
ncbi:MAG: hypothetical protein IT439_09920 [Phycisphaerales bacterium]|nr:hypothetical protein [Phycisphaerales bacterium]